MTSRPTRRFAALIITSAVLFSTAGRAGAQVTIDAPPSLASTTQRIQAIDLQPLARTLERAGLALPPRILITLIPERDPRADGAPRWIVGLASGRDRIVIFPERVGQYPYDSLEAVVRHEIAHLALNGAADDRQLPRWFHEGVAVSIESGWGFGGQIRLMLATFRDPAIQDLARLFASDAESDVTQAYLLATALVDDVLKRYGADLPGAIAARVAAGASFDRAFELEAGLSPDTAAAQAWARYLRWTTWIPVVTSTSAVWAVILALACVVYAVRIRRRSLRRRQWDEEDWADGSRNIIAGAEHSTRLPVLMNKPFVPARRTTLREERAVYQAGDAAARLQAVWTLTLQAWQFKEGLTGEPRLRRDLVRTVRSRG